MAKVGDIVRFLNSVGGGRIVRIDGSVAYVDEDGFETPVLLRECVVVTPAEQPQLKPAATTGAAAAPASKDRTPAPAAAPVVVKETPAGEKLTVLLAFEAADLKRLSRTSYDAFIVNDSNYHLCFSFFTRGDDTDLWTARYSGIIDPGIVEFLCEIPADDLPEMSRVAVQMVAFKKDKSFSLKPAVDFAQKLDTTKFCKLHCFQPNPYFDGPVLSIPIVTADRVAQQVKVEPDMLREAMKKKAADERSAPRPARKKRKDTPDELVVDLHIGELIDNLNGLSNADMLNIQIDAFRKVMDANLRNHGRKIIFIHGKGEGVLRQAILKELNHRYKGHDVQDASFLEYGFGATQVKIK